MSSKDDYSHSGFGNSGFSPSGFGNSGLGSVHIGASGIVPTSTANMPVVLLGLLHAMRTNESLDTFRLAMGVAQWEILVKFLQPFTMEAGQVLIEEGARDNTVYLIESGTVNVYGNDGSGHRQIAMVGAGSCVGEGAFFSRAPRNATVQAANRCKLWSISPLRFTELSNRHAPVALSFAMALGAVMARRMNSGPKRMAIT